MTSRIVVLIVPLWNWNDLTASTNALSTGFNRTFMELKCNTAVTQNTIPFRFNRTFMELKFIHVRIRSRVVSVLIVPLWNWNIQGTTGESPCDCFNRTFMELKCCIANSSTTDGTVLIVPLWNWNTLRDPLKSAIYGFNRTFMELKSRSCFHADCIKFRF